MTKGGSDKRPPMAVAPKGSVSMLPWKIFNFRASEMPFPAFSGAICGLIALKREQVSDRPARTPSVVLAVASHDCLTVRFLI